MTFFRLALLTIVSMASAHNAPAADRPVGYVAAEGVKKANANVWTGIGISVLIIASAFAIGAIASSSNHSH